MSQIRPEAQDMIGQTAVDQQGQELGEITDVIIGPQGQADAVVVQEGAVLGIGGREVAVPWDQVQISGDQVIVNMSQEELSQMPEYQSGN
ncbi:PRC-barrel domain-containing protein [Telmatospirillum sp. J64-1]|uniref:PRC-barrel domain-containing protein n=1 Tax=Telmatospirillum sp. J64-1 TaxID=2502183 RepID=UPI00115E180B|nr:PRC-barrel domain-containing protein [Telmatospirillum sp. J64-1]